VVLQAVLPLSNVDDGGGHLPLGGVVRGLRDGELAGAVGDDALLSGLKLREYSSDCSVLLTPVRVTLGLCHIILFVNFYNI
jgi:hypothetical protein